VERAAAYVRSQILPNSPVLLVVSKPDAWADGLWQRALYPNPIFLVYKQDLGTPDRLPSGKWNRDRDSFPTRGCAVAVLGYAYLRWTNVIDITFG
jgi:hypothetical protein